MSSPSPPAKRPLACLQCQRRKIRCDRASPCANCVRQGARCVPAAVAPRRRRFPERELLDRLRLYERLLRQHGIAFEPLHGPSSSSVQPPFDDVPEAPRQSETTVDFLGAISRVTLDDGDGDGDDGDAGDADQEQANDHFLLFGSPRPDVLVSALHPEQAQVFRLWQTYLDNVNPLLKVTHTPTLQPRIIDTAGDFANVAPSLGALIFSICCVSIRSLAEDDCRARFGSPRKPLLAGYRLACQQALLRCRALRCDDIDGLTALYLYLVSVGSQTDPRSLSSMLAVALRIAQRMGLHNESTNAKCTALEAEMRRRLWWSLVVFDHRICEMSEYKTTTLTPAWDCSTPLNANDFAIRKDMKTPPAALQEPSEALFAVVRSDIADFVRHSAFHLNFINPALNSMAQSRDALLEALERSVEDKYFASCDPEDPLHFMTIWTARANMARIRLLEHYSRHPASSVQQTDTQRNQALFHALRMLECDTKLSASPLIKGYRWLVDFHIPGLAYNYILNDLARRPAQNYADRAWDIMSDNYEARAMHEPSIIAVFSRAVLDTWGAREALLKQEDELEPLAPPRIVSDMRDKILHTFPRPSSNGSQMGINEASVPTTIGVGGQSFTTDNYLGIPGQASINVEMDQLWTTMDWRLMHTQGW
ncbi:hypothetical protein CDD83_5804 [Cordyceps sp. RAO-2017]|nr:hypothetical protein CDD83_5804 [Cordyceps sp. RAO-2017]